MLLYSPPPTYVPRKIYIGGVIAMANEPAERRREAGEATAL